MKGGIGFTMLKLHLLLSLIFIPCLANVSSKEDNKEYDKVREFVEETRSRRTVRTAVRKNVLLWPTGIVPFEIDKSLVKYKKYIFQAMNEYHAQTCIRLEPRKSTDKAYIRFVNDQYSDIGQNGFGPNIISLGPSCYDKATIMHEIGHALGFAHEHQRSDRDEYIVINIGKVEGDHEPKRQQFAKNGHNEDTILSEYDPDSLMHYGEDAFAKNGEVTISTDKEGTATLTSPMEKYGLSKLEIFAINVLYCEKN